MFVLGAGCRKPSSVDYYDAQGRYSSLVARQGNDAYLDPEMDRVTALLQQVSPNSMEADKAQQLLQLITVEKQRLEDEVLEASQLAQVQEMKQAKAEQHLQEETHAQEARERETLLTARLQCAARCESAYQKCLLLQGCTLSSNARARCLNPSRAQSQCNRPEETCRQKCGGVSAQVRVFDTEAPPQKPEVPAAPLLPRLARKVEVYSTSWCPACKSTVAYLQNENIPFEVYDIEADAAALVRKREIDPSYKGIPLVVIGSHKIHGFSPPEIEKALRSR